MIKCIAPQWRIIWGWCGLTWLTLCLKHCYPIHSPVRIPAAPFPIRLLANGLGKDCRLGWVLGHLHACGKPEAAPGSWPQTASALTIATIWVWWILKYQKKCCIFLSKKEKEEETWEIFMLIIIFPYGALGEMKHGQLKRCLSLRCLR